MEALTTPSKARVIGYSLFADSRYKTENYTDSIPYVVAACRALFPKWEVWIYHDACVQEARSWAFLEKMQELDEIKLIPMGDSISLGYSKLWRFKPLWEEGVEYLLCRDVDSIETYRNRRAVEQFIADGAGIHVLSDCETHKGISIMAGMCGLKVSCFLDRLSKPTWESFVLRYSPDRMNGYPADEELLSKEVWPVMQDIACEHRLSGYGERPKMCGVSWYTDLLSAPEVLSLDAKLRGGAADELTPYIGAACYHKDLAAKLYRAYLPAEAVACLSSFIGFSE